MSATKKPFFSIIIPTLNEEDYLPLLLGDLSTQTFQDFEIVVVDGHSEDNTQLIVKKNSRSSLYLSARKQVSTQRNIGATKTVGTYLIFMDADTRIPTYFLEGIKYKLSVTQADCFSTWVSQDGTSKTNKSIAVLINLLLESAIHIKFPGGYGAMIGCKKSVHAGCGGFDETLLFNEDGAYIRNIYKKGYSYHLFKDPKYIFSLRRFKKEGTLPLIQTYARLHLAKIFNHNWADPAIDYPMQGGGYYKKGKQIPSIIQRFEDTLQKLKGIKQTKRQITSLIEDFFSS